MSFLTSLGSVAGGFDQTFGPLLQQYQSDTATGQGIYAMMGMTPPQQQSGLGSLMGGAGPSNVPVTPPTTSFASPSAAQVPVTPPSLGQGGVAQSPMPQPSAAPIQQAPVAAPQQQAPIAPPVQPSPLPRGAPMNPTGGQQAPIGAQAGQQQAPQQTPQQQPSPQLQAQQNQPAKAPNLDQFNGQFDFNQLMHNLVRTPGMTPTKLGQIARSPAFERMLNQQGLNQYRALNLGIRQENAQTAQDRLSQQAEQFGKRQEALGQYREQLLGTKKQLQTGVISARAISQDAQARIAIIQQGLTAGRIDPAEAQKQIDAINADREKKIGGILSKMADPPEMKEGGEGGGSNALEEAQAAIKAGAPRDKVIERFKKNHPDLDASGL